MAMTFAGTVKNGGAYEVKGKDGSVKIMISFTVADEFGNTFSCQMWPDDPQHEQLKGVIKQMLRQQVQFLVASYTVRMRQWKDGRADTPQANFIVTNVQFPQLANQQQAPAYAS